MSNNVPEPTCPAWCRDHDHERQVHQVTYGPLPGAGQVRVEWLQGFDDDGDHWPPYAYIRYLVDGQRREDDLHADVAYDWSTILAGLDGDALQDFVGVLNATRRLLYRSDPLMLLTNSARLETDLSKPLFSMMVKNARHHLKEAGDWLATDWQPSEQPSDRQVEQLRHAQKLIRLARTLLHNASQP